MIQTAAALALLLLAAPAGADPPGAAPAEDPGGVLNPEELSLERVMRDVHGRPVQLILNITQPRLTFQ